MTNLTDQQIDRIARELAARLGGAPTPVPASAPVKRPAASGATAEALGDGVFADIDSAVAAATEAFRAFGRTTLETRGKVIASIRTRMLEQAENLARLAWQETGLGRLEDKIIKNRLVAEKTPGVESLRPVTWTGDRGLTLMEYAPFGVLGSITPTTNPTSTIICNAIGMLAAGNSVVFNVHPSAAACSMQTIRLINRAIVEAGGPQNLACAVAKPTIATAQQLMQHPGIRVLVVTGGAGVVKAAMMSGKRAICAGPGNPPVVVDETADIEAAAKGIVHGASFDNNIICVDEKEVFVVDGVADALIAAMKKHGAYLADSAEIRKLERVIFSENRGPGKPSVMNKDLIGKNAGVILEKIGVQRGPEVRLIIADVKSDHPLVWSEQMMPVLPIVRVPDVNRGIELAREAEHGFGHSAGMYSHDIDALSRMARVINTSIFVKNGPHVSGLGAGGEGHTSFTIASPTGEGLTYPVSFSRERRCVMVDHFRIV